MTFLKKYGAYILTFLAGIVAVLAMGTKPMPKGKPFDGLIGKTEDEIKDLDKELEKVQDGVEDKTPEEEIEYWKKH